MKPIYYVKYFVIRFTFYSQSCMMIFPLIRPLVRQSSS